MFLRSKSLVRLGLVSLPGRFFALSQYHVSANQARNDHFLSLLNHSRQQIINGRGKMLTNKVALYETDNCRVFAAEKDQFNENEIKQARNQIFKRMGYSKNCGSVQLIGDSANFSKDGAEFAKVFLKKIINSNQQSLFLYGWTGHDYDANGLFSQLIDEDPHLKQRVLANAVDFHTPKAIKDWKCNIGNVENIFLVYAQPEPEAKFGDDVIASDNLTTQSVICLEGGIQSFNQAVRMLNNGIPVIAISHLRGDENEATYDKELGCYISYFSAEEFLGLMKQVVEFGPSEVTSKAFDDAFNTTAPQFTKLVTDMLKYYNAPITTEDLVDCLIQGYLYDPVIHGSPYDPQSGLRVVANPNRPDYSTKAALFKQAMKEFFENKTWEKLDKLEVIDYAKIEHNYADQSSCQFTPS